MSDLRCAVIAFLVGAAVLLVLVSATVWVVR
jgi:hypothetical protein